MAPRKIPSAAREVFTYTFVTGEKSTVRPGENGVTEVHIKLLHSLQDAMVYNDLKNMRPPSTPEEKKQRKKWEEEHPGEKADRNFNISLDSFVSSENGASTADHHAASIDPRSLMRWDRDEPAEIERLHEIVDGLPKKLKDTYYEIVINKSSNVEAGKLFDVTEGAIRQRFKKIVKILAADETLRTLCTRGIKQNHSR